MKKVSFFSLLICVVFSMSCSKEEDNKTKTFTYPTACLNIANTEIKLGETLVVSNCSEDAIEYEYFWGGEETSLDELNSKIFNESGTFNLSLNAINENNAVDVFSKLITILPAENSAYLPSYMDQGNYYSLACDINPINGAMYYIEKSDSFYYREIDENFEVTKSINLGEITTHNNTSSYRLAFAMFLEDGASFIQIPYNTATSISRKEFKVNNSGISESNFDLWEFDLNYLKLNDNLFSVGGRYMENDAGKNVYHATVNELDLLGNIVESHNFSIEGRDALIGNLISTSDGYMAFGGVYDVIKADQYNFANYKSKLFYFNNDFELQNTIDLSDESVSRSATSFTINYHIKEVPNSNNLLLYGPGTLYIVKPNGEKVTTIPLDLSFGTNSILVKEEYFILSEFDHLKKYDFQGNLLAQVKHQALTTSGIFDYHGEILFMATKTRQFDDGHAAWQMYFSKVDDNLNFLSF
ncbi:hypothetical protein GH721_05685 [Kriegella sp. EG-1]|nr:hypothetical protein [Flavobacteriaceae bacterium EG-1]